VTEKGGERSFAGILMGAEREEEALTVYTIERSSWTATAKRSTKANIS
jgi:hypothetical protein